MTLLLSHRRLVKAAALTLLVSLAGFGAAACATHTDAVTINMDGTAFSPADVTVTVGQTVTWVNKDPFPHTATSDTKVFDSKDIASGASWSYTTTAKGDFPYTCSYHPTMKGVLHVK